MARASRSIKARKSDPLIDGPTPEQLRQDEYRRVQIKEPGKAQPRIVTKNTSGDNLERWYNRGLISRRQLAAAKRYQSQHRACHFGRGLTARYEPRMSDRSSSPDQSGYLPASLAQLDAREAFAKSRKALPASLIDRFDRIVLEEVPLRSIGAPNGVGTESGAVRAMEWLRIGLDELIAHYWPPEPEL